MKDGYFIWQEFHLLKLEMNGACEGSPALIVLPQSDSDVSLALRAATSAGLSVSVRGGGHR